LRDVAAQLPLESVLVETDAPWLTPAPDRGKRNEPALVVRTAQVLAEAMGKPEDEIGPATTKNFYRLFQLHLDVGN
jgi:TatD DNase family protein